MKWTAAASRGKRREPMEEVVRFALLGFGLGALYSLASQGLLLIYRGSGVLNFGHGAIGMVGAYIEWVVTEHHHLPYVVGLLAGVGTSATIGAATHLLVMRKLRRASPLARMVATLGVLITCESAILIKFGSAPRYISSPFPATRIRLGGSVVISADRVILMAIAIVLTAGLWALYKYTKFGLATSAVAENELSAATLGWSPDTIATANWTLGSALAGLAAILISPIVTLQVTLLTNLVLAALAAALVASFRSYPVAFVAAVLIGMTQSLLDRFATQPGLGASVPFVLIVIVMVVRGRSLPLRDFFLQRLPRIGDGRIRPVVLVGAIAVAAALISTTSVDWVYAISISMATALVLLSVVVVTGYTGQLSLAQYALAGFGAWACGRLIVKHGLPFLPAALLGILATIPVGIAFVLPAARTRGINFAVVTLGLGTALEYLLFDNGTYSGFNPAGVVSLDLFGWNFNPVAHPSRYAFVTLGVLVLAGLAVANVRRGRSGRRLIAVRTNERAAAALGISVPFAKLYAFGLSAAIAGAGGILIAFHNSAISFQSFTSLISIRDVGWAMIGGIGYVLGPLYGSVLTPDGVGEQFANTLYSGLAKYVALLSGVLLLLLVLRNQDGIARGLSARARAGRHLAALLAIVGPRSRAPMKLPPEKRTRVAPRTLEVRDLSVRFGVTVAVDRVSLTVRPGRVLGLIGPNGAGKTTLIDAVTGFVRPFEGQIQLDDEVVTRLSVTRRARRGISRSFQSLELFEDCSVLDNLRVAADPRDVLSYLRDLVYPVQPVLPGEVVAAIREFGLEDDLAHIVEDLPYGKRRLLAIARAVAISPSVLLLDEPAAGLDDAQTAELVVVVKRLATEWGVAVLLVEHDMDFVMQVCDEIVVLDLGRRIAQGTPAEIQADPAVIAAYLGRPGEYEMPGEYETPAAV
jgi:ABC-type branched-subunit amino acid transport system ATPase component/branched-subunit amino acid ABC-type transport system permease component